jgi:HEXXH motif-containing protein
VAHAAAQRAEGDIMDSIHEGFASPHEDLDNTTIDIIAGQRAAIAAKRFLESFASNLGDGLPQLLGAQVVEDTPAHIAWTPRFSMLEHCVLGTPSGEPAVYAAEAALALHEGGVQGKWSFAFEGKARLRFDRYVLPASTRGAVAASNGQVEVAADCGLVVFERRVDGEWAVRHDLGDDEVAVLPRAGNVTFLSAAALDGRDDGVIPFPLIEADAAVLGAWEAAFDLIARVSQPYAEWVRRGIRLILPLEAQPGAMINGSQGHRWGEVHMSSRLEPLRHAEMLVHEASHQHYFLAESLGPVGDGSDPTTYYSPLVREQRPIERILLAYHAVANILLFYDAYEAAGFDITPFFTANRAQLRSEMEQLVGPLHSNHGLTAVGQGMWQPLESQLSRTCA